MCGGAAQSPPVLMLGAPQLRWPRHRTDKLRDHLTPYVPGMQKFLKKAKPVEVSKKAL